MTFSKVFWAFPLLLSALTACLAGKGPAKLGEPSSLDPSLKPSDAAKAPLATLSEDERMRGFVALEPADLNFEAKPAGIQWRNFLLPVRDVSLTDADFALGLIDSFGGKFRPGPFPGTCLTSQEALLALQRNKAQTPAEKPSLRSLKIIIRSENIEKKPLAGHLFTVLDPKTSQWEAVGRLNEAGESVCELPEKEWLLSVGTGMARQETEIPPQVREFSFVTEEPGQLRVLPGFTESPSEGTLLRLGRIQKPIQASAGKALSLDDWQNLSIPTQVAGDLFRPLSSPSENFTAREVFHSTLLLGESAFTLNLQPGDYVAVGVKPGGERTCLAFFTIQSGHVKRLQCESDKNSAPKDAVPMVSARFDATLFPTSLRSKVPWLRWMQKAGFTHILEAEPKAFGKLETEPVEAHFTPLAVTEANEEVREEASEENSNFNAEHSHTLWLGPLSNYTNATRAQMARVFSARETLEGEERIAQFFKKSDASILPLAGTGETNLSERVTPFLLTTQTAREGQTVANSAALETREWSLSNGPQWSLKEPEVGANALLLRPSLQKRVRAELRHTAEQKLDHAEIWVDGVLIRRLAVPPAEGKGVQVFSIEEKVEKEQDFTLSFSAWSHSFLPELIYGGSTESPFALTRIYCVDANENGICEATR
jgi:hypothetical protein